MIFKYHFIILLNTTLTVSLQNTHFPPFFISVGTAASANKSNRPKTHRGKKDRLINSGSMRFNLRYNLIYLTQPICCNYCCIKTFLLLVISYMGKQLTQSVDCVFYGHKFQLFHRKLQSNTDSSNSMVKLDVIEYAVFE